MAWDSQSTEALVRFMHVISGITWIGLLYFFNLVNLPVFNVNIANGDPSQKGGPHLMLRALWWFRWAAMSTLVFGVLLLYYIVESTHSAYLGNWSQFFSSGHGKVIGGGMLLALVMWFNVWFIIWPNQKVVLGNNIRMAKGLPDEEKKTLEEQNKPRVAKAKMASRVNFWLSIPMLLLMVFAAHAQHMFA